MSQQEGTTPAVHHAGQRPPHLAIQNRSSFPLQPQQQQRHNHQVNGSSPSAVTVLRGTMPYRSISAGSSSASSHSISSMTGQQGQMPQHHRTHFYSDSQSPFIDMSSAPRPPTMYNFAAPHVRSQIAASGAQHPSWAHQSHFAPRLSHAFPTMAPSTRPHSNLLMFPPPVVFHPASTTGGIPGSSASLLSHHSSSLLPTMVTSTAVPGPIPPVSSILPLPSMSSTTTINGPRPNASPSSNAEEKVLWIDSMVTMSKKRPVLLKSGSSSEADSILLAGGGDAALLAPQKRRRKSKKDKKLRAHQTGNGAVVAGVDGEQEREFNGEERLSIQFDSYGKLGDTAAKLGKKGQIPDGLSGSFTMYAERWAFLVQYSSVSLCKDGKDRVCIEWCIKSSPSWSDYHRVVETPDDAQRRETRGFTLCNRVFREAMQRRAEEYEKLAEQERQSPTPNPLQINNFEKQAVFLRPDKVSEGPLLFGLRHRAVQESFRSTSSSSTDSAGSSTDSAGSNSGNVLSSGQLLNATLQPALAT